MDNATSTRRNTKDQSNFKASFNQNNQERMYPTRTPSGHRQQTPGAPPRADSPRAASWSEQQEEYVPDPPRASTSLGHQEPFVIEEFHEDVTRGSAHQSHVNEHQIKEEHNLDWQGEHNVIWQDDHNPYDPDVVEQRGAFNGQDQGQEANRQAYLQEIRKRNQFLREEKEKRE